MCPTPGKLTFCSVPAPARAANVSNRDRIGRRIL
jgi:hypothetical protein